MKSERARTAAPLLSALLAVLVLVGVAAPFGARASSSGSAASVDFERYGGADRYATSLKIAEAVLADAGSAQWAVMVSGESWLDAVVASSLAGALGAPVLLTPPQATSQRY
ncbi:MAG: cell wall-binding repeat-containing protein [Acidimicrobiaceae bacterium]|nr:cell wall-binding repeat-containing protein [Acidimicrobiaceae bacterium]